MQQTSILSGGSFINETPTHIFSVDDFSRDERMMIDVAEQFCRKDVLPVVDRMEAQEEGLMPELIRRAGELGLCGVDTPEEYGGLGQSKNVAARILEFMSLNGSFSVTYGITSGISQVGLTLFGTEEQKAEYLPRLTSGEWIGAYALSEPNSGSDALSASTRADRNGGDFVLNGTKMWISNAKWAHLFLVMAKVDGERFSAFLVERDSPGLTVEREEHKMGLKGSSTARVTLENCRIPARNLLHEEGKGHQVAFNALNIGRFKLSSMSIGPAREAIEQAAVYASERRQFGRPIAEFGLIQQKFSMARSLFYWAESMIYRTGAMVDSAFDAFGGTVEGNRQAAEAYALECSAAKVFSTEAEGWIVDEMLQVFGGYGFTEEYPMARHYRDARVSRIYEGTNEINRLFIADRVARKLKSGELRPESAGDSVISGLLDRALALPIDGQIAQGAFADLVILTYAEQSARLRSQREGRPELYEGALKWANAQASWAFARLTD